MRQLINVRDLSTFQRFVRICAAHTAQLMNLSSLANDCGINHTTARAWLSVMEASYLIRFLQPHFSNFNKRLVKSPKLYFLDTGLASRLLGIQTVQQLALHPQCGALFETWVVGELFKARFNRALSSNLYFWRDHTGNEIDIIVEQSNRLIPIEVKSGQTVSSDFFKGLNYWQNMAGETAVSGAARTRRKTTASAKQSTGKSWLVYGGDQNQGRSSAEVVSWKHMEGLVAVVSK